MISLDAYHPGAHYEYKKTLIGFRLKVAIHSGASDPQSYCIFVEVAKYKTVGELSLDINRRFVTTNYESHKLFVDDFEVPSDEPILVLVGVEILKIQLFTKSPASKSSLGVHSVLANSEKVQGDSHWSSKPSYVQKGRKIANRHSYGSLAFFLNQVREEDRSTRNESVHATSKSPPDGSAWQQSHTFRSVDRTSYTTSIPAKRSSPEQSLEEFYKHLKNEGEDAVSNKNENSAMECDVDLSASRILTEMTSSPYGKKAVENDMSIDACESFAEKPKHKRRRKHSKKKTKDAAADVVDASSMPSLKREIPQSSGMGKHIFFKDGENYETVDNLDDKRDDTIDPRHPIVDVRETASIPTQVSSDSSTDSELDCTNGVPQKRDHELVDRSCPTESAVTGSVLQDRIRRTSSMTSVHSSKTDDSSLTIRSQSNPKIGKELGTLLMYKDLRTSGRYDIQFANNSRHSNRTNDSVPVVSVPKKSLRDKEETSAEDSGMKKQKLEDGSGRKQLLDDCEMTFQYRVEEDKIFVRYSDVEWQPLTAEKAVTDFKPATIPIAGQTIVFQFCYLKHTYEPAVSELILGRVLKYDSAKRRVAMEITPSLLEHVYSFDPDLQGKKILPEGIIHITHNVYELEWEFVREPRLLSQ